MTRFSRRVVLVSAVLACAAATARASAIPTPSEFLGFPVGADRTLADYRQIRVVLRRRSTRPRPASRSRSSARRRSARTCSWRSISSEANLANLHAPQGDRAEARRPARPHRRRGRRARRARGRSFLLVTCNIHSTRDRLVADGDGVGARARHRRGRPRRSAGSTTWSCSCSCRRSTPTARSWRPSGTASTSARATRAAGCRGSTTTTSGHDNNRDWYMLTQKETKAVTRAVYHEWFPQVWLDEHQMGSTGPRIFIPPYSEPVDPDIHPLVWREVNLIGANMALPPRAGGQGGRHLRLLLRRLLARRHEEHGLVEEHLRPAHRGRLGAARDAGPDRARASCAGGAEGPRRVRAADELPEPVARRLVAAARHHGLRADRLRRDPRDLRRAARGLPARHAARARPRVDRDLRRRGTPTASRAEQRDPATAPRLAALLAEHDVELRRGAERRRLRPARPALRPRSSSEMLTAQRYPEVKLVPGKDIVRPYDVAAWTLPLMMGVEVERATLARRASGPGSPSLRACRPRAAPSPSPPAAPRARSW